MTHDEVKRTLVEEFGVDPDEIVKNAREKKGEPAGEEFRTKAQRIYDVLFVPASLIVRAGEEHAALMANFSYAAGTMVSVPHILTEEFGDGSSFNKDQVAFTHRGYAHAGFISVLIIEAWAKSYPKDTPEKDMAKSLVKDHDGEVLMFNFMYRGQQLIAYCPIDRRARKLEKADLIDPLGVAKGRMVNEPRLAS